VQIETNGIGLGDYVRDEITQVEGTAIAVLQYLTGCARALVQPRVGADGKVPEALAVDVLQLTVIRTVVGDLYPANADAGGPQPSPSQRVALPRR
jgi:hypothetical protein